MELREKKNGEVSDDYKLPRLFRNSLTNKIFTSIKPIEKPKMITERSLRENLWWLLILFTGSIIAFSIIERAWQRFQQNPTFTSILLNHENQKIVYPTVNVCPDDFINFERISILNESDFATKNYDKLNLNLFEQLSKKFNSNDIRRLIFASSYKCLDIMRNCVFKGKSFDCCSNFSTTLSDRGLCFSFNSDKIHDEYGEYKNPEIITIAELEEHSLTFDTLRPSKIYIHSRDENSISKDLMRIKSEIGNSVKVLISMRQTLTDKNAKPLKINQRKCIFDDEIKSNFYKNEKYSLAGCIRDCKIEKILTFCKCLSPFHRPKYLNSTACKISDIPCFYELNFQSCHSCHLPCNHTVINIDKIITTEIPKNISKIEVDFLHWPLITFNREIRFGFIDFLVAFGSILSLFLGFSILSAVEIILHVSKIFLSCKK